MKNSVKTNMIKRVNLNLEHKNFCYALMKGIDYFLRVILNYFPEDTSMNKRPEINTVPLHN